MLRSLLRSQTVGGARQDLSRLYHGHLARPRAAIRRYLETAPVPSLHIGAGGAHLPGWLATDVDPPKGQIYLNAAKPFPVPDDSFQYIYSEHMIEHVALEGGRTMLRECRRVLKPGGVLRLATPDLAFQLSLYDSADELGKRYVKWMAETHLRDPSKSTPVFTINHVVRAWGHQFLYDAPTLEAELKRAGFENVQRVEYGQSNYEMLRGIECHHQTLDEEMVRAETMLFEAS